jgi:hypothetical protein
MEQTIDKKLLSMFFVFVITFGFFTIYVVFNEPIIKFTQAKDELVPSNEKSLVFIWPLELAADGKEKSKVTIFIRNIKGKSMSNKQVQLSSTLGNVVPTKEITDKEGKVIFNLTSNNSGVAEIEAVVDNVKIKKDVTIKFE